MNLRLRRKYFNILGTVGATIQIVRYSFDMLGDYRMEVGAFIAFSAMALNVKGLGISVINIFKNGKKDAS